MQIGRKIIYTDEPEITKDNVLDILRRAFPEHQQNANRIDFLLRYDAGEQPLARKKKYRSDIDCHCVDNVANEITEFHLGFKWGNPITLVQRGEKDSGRINEASAICQLNEQYEMQNIRSKTQKLGRFVEVGGIGYTYVDVNTDYNDGDSFFLVEALDPRTTFVIRSSYYIDNRPMLGVTYRTDSSGNRLFTCFSKDLRFEIKNFTEIKNGKDVPKVKRWDHRERSGEANPLGMIPIIEWFRSYDRMGCFERQISEMDNLNLLVSDFTNDVEQNTQAIWHSNDVEFPKEIIRDESGNEKEVVRKPKTNEWMQTFTSQDGKTPFVEALAVNYDYAGMLNNIITRRSLILQKCNVPSRSNDSGGSTALAMDSATGWSAAETAASKQQNIMESCKMEEVKVVLKAISLSPSVDAENPMQKLRYSDVQPNIKRQKNFELTTKINFFATAVSHGIHGLHALKAANIFEDTNQVFADSKELIEKYQSSVFDKDTENSAVGGEGEEKPNADRKMPDLSDQMENSPFISG